MKHIETGNIVGPHCRLVNSFKKEVNVTSQSFNCGLILFICCTEVVAQIFLNSSRSIKFN